MALFTLQASALDGPVDGLLNLYVLVCDDGGELVAALPDEAFSCQASMPSGLFELRNEGVIEQGPGCYHLAFHHEPKVRIDLLRLSVRQRSRTNPWGLAPVHRTVAQGHLLLAPRTSPRFDI